jgi:hypothetical protein
VARPLSAVATETTTADQLILVQNRPIHRDRNSKEMRQDRSSFQSGRSFDRGHNWRRDRWRYSHNRDRYYWGAGGLALGLGLGLAASPYAYGPSYYAAPDYAGDDAVAYCMSRFRSYDPRSGTYLGYDGLRHPCP